MKNIFNNNSNKRTRKKSNKKGSWFVDNLGQMVLVALGIGIGIYLIWAYVLHGSGDSIKNLQQCGSLTGNQGECKEYCDSVTEITFDGLGCTGVTSKCCVLKESGTGDVILPTGYGNQGQAGYDFEITGFYFGNLENSGCEPDNLVEDPTITIRCTPNVKHTIPIIMTVKNSGNAIEVYSAPFVVINGNADRTKKIGTYVSAPAISFNKGVDKPPITVNLPLTSKDAVKNDFWTIYPYAKCETDDCKKSDSRGRGVLVYNPEKSVKIKFVSG